jgi:nucleotide-binding universal stress UspA family protein
MTNISELDKTKKSSSVRTLPFKRILVPTDFGESSSRALTMAIEFATQYGSLLTLFHAYEIPSYAYPGSIGIAVDLLSPIQEAAKAQFDELLARLREQVPAANGILGVGSPWQEITQQIAETNADLVVMGTHGRSGVRHILLGSIAETIVRTSRVPVLTVH